MLMIEKLSVRILEEKNQYIDFRSMIQYIVKMENS